MDFAISILLKVDLNKYGLEGIESMTEMLRPPLANNEASRPPSSDVEVK